MYKIFRPKIRKDLFKKSTKRQCVCFPQGDWTRRWRGSAAGCTCLRVNTSNKLADNVH